LRKIFPGALIALAMFAGGTFALAVLAVLMPAALARGASAFSGAEPGGGVRPPCAQSLPRPAGAFDRERQYIRSGRVRSDYVRGQKPAVTDETASRESERTQPEDPGKAMFDRRRLPASDERVLSLSKVFSAERFLREKSPESAAAKPGPLAAAKVSASVFSKSKTDPPAILLLSTQIAVRK
jgi:hypothetical protein